MVSFYDGQVMDILPVNLTEDPRVRALSYALREGTRMLYDHARKAYIHTAVDQQSEEVLDLLAAELRAQYYRDDMPLETKRDIVRGILVWHMTAGTSEAVEGLVSAIFGHGEVEEWFEYGGDPYTFRVRIASDTGPALTPERDRLFWEMLQKVKNTRSHMQSIGMSRGSSGESYAAAGHFMIHRPAAIIDGYTVTEEAIRSAPAHVGGITRSTHGSTIKEG